MDQTSSQSKSSELLSAVQELQRASSVYQAAQDRLMELQGSAPVTSQAIRSQSKTLDENCLGCGHQRSRHAWGYSHCTCSIPLGGANPGFTHCRCAAFNDVVHGDTAPLISMMSDRRDNRDPSSYEMTSFTRHELAKLRAVSPRNYSSEGIELGE